MKTVYDLQFHYSRIIAGIMQLQSINQCSQTLLEEEKESSRNSILSNTALISSSICIVILLIKPLLKFIYNIWSFLVSTIRIFKIGNLKEKYGEWAVITGCTDGIGKEFALELARHRLNIVLIGRTLTKLNKMKMEIQTINIDAKVLIIEVDFRNIKEAITNIENQLKTLHTGILVNNVGKLTDCPMYMDEIPTNELIDIININITTATLISQIVIKGMKNRHKGAIINVSSIASLVPLPMMSVYSSSKIYIQYLSSAIKQEYSKFGLTIQCLIPYFIDTKMITHFTPAKYNPFIPTAKTYVKHAIYTLGKLDCTTGYWLHDICKMLLLLPDWILQKIVMKIGTIQRNRYFMLQENQIEES